MRFIVKQIHLPSAGPLMRRALRLGVVLIVLATGGTGDLAPQVALSAEPEIVARVNGAAVTRQELQNILSDSLTERSLLQEFGADKPKEKDLERLAVRKLIHHRLFLQEAERRGFTVTEAELDQSLLVLRKRFEDLDKFGAWMHDQGLDDQSLFDTLRSQILMTKVWERLVEGVVVRPEQVKGYYETHKENLFIGEEVRLRIIAVRDAATAEEILAKLKRGKNFARLAQERSLGLRASQGGDTGWVNYKTLPPVLQQAVSLLQSGDVSGPLQRSPEEYLLVGLEGRRSLPAKNLEQARPEIEQRLLAEQRQKVVDAWLEEQEKQAKIEILL
jgi:peptidyl-prolyl cis-trans isomerase SurA